MAELVAYGYKSKELRDGHGPRTKLYVLLCSAPNGCTEARVRRERHDEHLREMSASLGVGPISSRARLEGSPKDVFNSGGEEKSAKSEE